MTAIDLILFDCDGVLVDSEVLAARLGAHLFGEYGVDISTQDLCARYAGMESSEILKQVRKEYKVALPADLFERSQQMLDDLLFNELREIDGAHEVLERIAGPRCICSNSSSGRLDLELTRTGLKPFFAPYIFSAMDLGPGRTKPRPDIYLHGAAEFDADPSRCLVVEDSVHGVHAAVSAGMHVIGFTGGGHSYPAHAGQLRETGAEVVISRLSELPGLVEMYQCGERPTPAP
ncbi:MAG: HAD family hydrolase [Gammaproteobacteria bacterium]|nr:HAD family hydrolase [Gammaproteobacteria bacterium]